MPWEASRRHSKQMPESPQLAPFDVEEKRHHSQLLPDLAQQSWVISVNSRGESTHPCGTPVFMMVVAEELFPTLTVCGLFVSHAEVECCCYGVISGALGASLATEEIFELFERTITDYKEEICRQRKLLDAVLQPEVRLHRADVELRSVSEGEDPPERLDWSPNLDKQEPPELPHTEEEKEELWTSFKPLRGLEETDVIEAKFTPVSVKSEEEEEEKPQSSLLHQRQIEEMKTEPDGEDCEGPEPARSSDPDTQPDTDDKSSRSSDCETDDSCDWKESREPRSGLSPLQDNEGHQQKHGGLQTEERPFSCSVCGQKYHRKKSFMTHMELHSEGKRFSCSVCQKTFQRRADVASHLRTHTGEKPFSCSVCGKRFRQKNYLSEHMRVHSAEKCFSCSVCQRPFRWRSAVVVHMRVHTGEKPFSCSVCSRKFSLKLHLRQHMRIHTGEKPFSCSVCKQSFKSSTSLSYHIRTHTGEKPFSCSVCAKRFLLKSSLTEHMRVHSGEKHFCCSVCKAAFRWKATLHTHMRVHTGEKPFTCSVCGKSFAQSTNMKQHMRVHTRDAFQLQRL
uniref:zinc finger protein 260-like n=1 Tax=Scatophagus argus TaxID=75038 RepID=UPI001ED7DC7D|nr:zinc finger protein 260-like [Scatophagus argus]